MCQQRDISVPRKHRADDRYRGNCGITITYDTGIEWSECGFYVGFKCGFINALMLGQHCRR